MASWFADNSTFRLAPTPRLRRDAANEKQRHLRSGPIPREIANDGRPLTQRSAHRPAGLLKSKAGATAARPESSPTAGIFGALQCRPACRAEEGVVLEEGLLPLLSGGSHLKEVSSTVIGSSKQPGSGANAAVVKEQARAALQNDVLEQLRSDVKVSVFQSVNHSAFTPLPPRKVPEIKPKEAPSNSQDDAHEAVAQGVRESGDVVPERTNNLRSGPEKLPPIVSKKLPPEATVTSPPIEASPSVGTKTVSDESDPNSPQASNESAPNVPTSKEAHHDCRVSIEERRVSIESANNSDHYDSDEEHEEVFEERDPTGIRQARSILNPLPSEIGQKFHQPPMMQALVEQQLVPLGTCYDDDDDDDSIDPDLEELEAKAEQEALDQTLSAHFVLMGVEQEIMHVAQAAARQDMKDDGSVHIQCGRRKGSLVAKTKGNAQQMLSFVPNSMRRCIRHGLVNLKQRKVLFESPVNSWYDPVLSRFPGAVVFADASGFTRLTETLQSQPHGAEQIGDTLNDFFGPLIEIIHKHKGDVIKFSGDALTIIWAAAEPAPNDRTMMDSVNEAPGRASNARSSDGARESVDYGAKRAAMEKVQRERAVAAVSAAARCCLEIQEQIPTFGQTPVPGCSLTMHIGVGFGDLALLQLGGLLGRWEFCVAGTALDQISIAEPLAKSGETVFSPEARALVADRFSFDEIASTDAGGAKGFAKLQSQRDAEGQVEELEWWRIEEAVGLDLRLVKRYIPSAVAIRLACSPDAEAITYPEEMRRISVVFVSIHGLDAYRDTPRDSMTKLSGSRETQLIMRLMQRSVYALEGSVNKFLIDDKGATLLIVFGLPPLVHFTDDPLRAVLCAMRMCDTIRDEGLKGRVGVATGLGWCGVLGSQQCREYTVLGDVVNLSARLMGSAPPDGVLVDSETRKASARKLDFEDWGELLLKGKQQPVPTYRFLDTHRGLKGHRKELHKCLDCWRPLPARIELQQALRIHERSSGVIFIRGPGGVGKTELSEEVRNWTAERGWTLLAGQNMDPFGIFSLPRLALQEIFRDLVRLAVKDEFWRLEAWKLLLTSLGEEELKAAGINETEMIDCGVFRRGNPTHAELYWILVAMLRRSQGEKAKDLEPWAPLLSLVVTQLAFGPRMVSAMMERDEQHIRHSRFAELVAAVVHGFSQHSTGKAQKGTVLLFNYRCSSAVFQSKDEKESQVMHHLVDLCMRLRSEAPPDGEDRPLVLCIVSREGTLKEDEYVQKAAKECGGLVRIDDLNKNSSADFVRHCLQTLKITEEATSQLGASSAISAAASRRQSAFISVVGSRRGSTRPIASPLPTKDYREQNVLSQAAGRLEAVSQDMDVLGDYVFELTGGNPLGVLTLLQELERQGVLQPHRAISTTLTLTADCKSVEWLRSKVQYPPALVAMAFSVFERLGPKEQMVLKAASTIDGDFSLMELKIALDSISLEDLSDICSRLSKPSSHTLRRVVTDEVAHTRAARDRSSVAGDSSPKWPGSRRNSDARSPGPPSSNRRLSVSSRKQGPSGQLSRRQSRVLEERFQFYSLLMRHVATTLVLETQRVLLRGKAAGAADFQIDDEDLAGLQQLDDSTSEEEYDELENDSDESQEE